MKHRSTIQNGFMKPSARKSLDANRKSRQTSGADTRKRRPQARPIAPDTDRHKSGLDLAKYQSALKLADSDARSWVRCVERQASASTKIKLRNAKTAQYEALAEVLATLLAWEDLSRTVRHKALKALNEPLAKQYFAALNREKKTAGIAARRPIAIFLLAMTDHVATGGAGSQALSRDVSVLEHAKREGIEPNRFVKEISKPGGGLEAWSRLKDSTNGRASHEGRSLAAKAPGGGLSSRMKGLRGSGIVRSPLPGVASGKRTRVCKAAKRTIVEPGYYVMLLKVSKDEPNVRVLVKGVYAGVKKPDAELWDHVERQFAAAGRKRSPPPSA